MIDLLLSRLDKVRKVGSNSYVACCPAHGDKTPSLSITEAKGKILVYCHAGCYPDEIISAAGLEWGDLFEDEWDAAHQRALTAKKPLGPVDPLRVDENVLLITRAKLEKGETLSVDDQARAELAYERVREAYSA
jgi:hypothetical protein